METWTNNGVRYILEQDYEALKKENERLNKVIEDMLSCYRKTTDTMIQAEAIVNQLANRDKIYLDGEPYSIPEAKELLVDQFLKGL